MKGPWSATGADSVCWSPEPQQLCFVVSLYSLATDLKRVSAWNIVTPPLSDPRTTDLPASFVKETGTFHLAKR